MSGEMRGDRETGADALIDHMVPSPVSDGTIALSGMFDWQTLLGIADAVLALLPAPHPEDICGERVCHSTQHAHHWIEGVCPETALAAAPAPTEPEQRGQT